MEFTVIAQALEVAETAEGDARRFGFELVDKIMKSEVQVWKEWD